MEPVIGANDSAANRNAEALWRKWHERGDVAARDRLVLSFAPLVKYLACRKVRVLPAHCEVDDLISCGLLALRRAVDQWDPAKGANFETYAWMRVSGAILDELRRLDWAPRSLRRFGRTIENTRHDWQCRYGRSPSDEELSDELEISIGELRDQLDRLSRADLLSLNTPTSLCEEAEVGDTLVAPASDHDPEFAVLVGERSSVLKEAIALLSQREQEILTLLYVHRLQGGEVGRILGISESRVSQIMKDVRYKLKRRLESYDLSEATNSQAA